MVYNTNLFILCCKCIRIYLYYLLFILLWRVKVADDVIIRDKTTVVQSNNLINLKQKFNLREFRLFLYCVSKIDDRNDKDLLQSYRIYTKELGELIGKTNSNLYYKKIREIFIGIMKHIVTIRNPKTGNIYDTHYIQSVDYHVGKGYLDVMFDNKLKEDLIDLKGFFTKYDVKYILPLSSPKYIKLYNLLKSFESVTERIFTLAEFKELLDAENASYDRFYNLKVRVLEPGIKELQKYTDIKVSYEVIKDGKTICGLKFNIYANDKNIDKKDQAYRNVYNRLLELKFDSGWIERLIKKYKNDYEYIDDCIEYAIRENIKVPKKNLQGFVVSCIENGYRYVKAEDDEKTNQQIQFDLERKKEEEKVERRRQLELERKRKEEEFEKKKFEKLNKMKKEKLNDETLTAFLDYMKKKGFLSLLGKPADKVNIKDMEKSPFFGGYLIEKFFDEDEKDFDVFLAKEGDGEGKD